MKQNREAEVKLPFRSSTALFTDRYTSKSVYEEAGIKWIEPMTAKEPLDYKMLQSMLDNPEIVAEDKLDGTRCLLHLTGQHCRAFSRTVSKKTKWFSENSDRLPHIRDLEYDYQMGYTVIDGELKIPGKPFETVSGILNSLPEEAIERQLKEGWVVLNAFDCLWYDGKCIEDKPLRVRKQYLKKVIDMLDSEFVVEVPWFQEQVTVTVPKTLIQRYISDNAALFSAYPLLHEAIRRKYSSDWDKKLTLTKAEYYDYVVALGGEGIMLKDPNGKYHHKRGREFTKYKKFLTRDCVAVKFNEPTKEYTGKDVNSWGYWVTKGYERLPFTSDKLEIESYRKSGAIPVTKPFYHNWVGNLVLGVFIDGDDLAYLRTVNGADHGGSPKGLTFEDYSHDHLILIVGECSGFDDVSRSKYTKDPSLIIGKTVEVGCNEVFKKTGKLRHPRFMRVREDKDPTTCIFKDHIQSDGDVN